MKQGAPTRLASLQCLRAVAALGVVLFHAGQWSHINLHLGGAGVDLFFVISGVVMWLVTDRREREPVRFLMRRAARIVPLYWLMTAAAAALALVLPVVWWDVRPDLVHVLLSAAFIPHYNPGGLPFPALAQGWTLPYEALFYGLFAVALRFPRERQFLVLAFALAAIFVIGFANPPFYMLLGNSLLLEFVLGMALARILLSRSLPSGPWGLALMILGSVGLAASWPIGGDDPGNWRLLVWGLPAAAIVGGALSLEAAGWWPRLPWLERLGDASYALYLSHRLSMAGGMALVGVTTPAAIFLVALIAALSAGLGLYYGVDRPLQAAFAKRLNA
jgi:exopolysaccharide production protein ExoZ